MSLYKFSYNSVHFCICQNLINSSVEIIIFIMSTELFAQISRVNRNARGAKTQFLKCAHRAKAYGAAWLARAELLARQPLSQDKNALEYASFHILTESIRLGATALKAADDSFWVNHISGYEHNVKRREGAEAAENSVNAMVARSA